MVNEAEHEGSSFSESVLPRELRTETAISEGKGHEALKLVLWHKIL